MIALTNGQITARDVLKLRPPRGKLDPSVVRVLEKIKKDRKDTVQRVLDLIESQGLTLYIQELRDKLDRAVEADVTRALLATPGVLEEILEPIVTPQAPPTAASTSLEPVTNEIRDLSYQIQSMPDRFARIMWQILKEAGAYGGGTHGTVSDHLPNEGAGEPPHHAGEAPDDAANEDDGGVIGAVIDAVEDFFSGDDDEAARKPAKPRGTTTKPKAGGSR